MEPAERPAGAALDPDVCLSMLAKYAGKGLVVRWTDPVFTRFLLGEVGSSLARQGLTSAHFATLGAWCSLGKHGRTQFTPSLRTLQEDGILADWLGRSGVWWEGLSKGDRAKLCPDGYPVLTQEGAVRGSNGGGSPSPTMDPVNLSRIAIGRPPTAEEIKHREALGALCRKMTSEIMERQRLRLAGQPSTSEDKGGDDGDGEGSGKG